MATFYVLTVVSVVSTAWLFKDVEDWSNEDISYKMLVASSVLVLVICVVGIVLLEMVGHGLFSRS